MEVLSYLFIPFREPILLVAVALGTLVGVYIGAIPGLTGTMGVSLLVSMTFSWDHNLAIAAMIGVYVGAVYGGSRGSILLNIPGAPGAVATIFDGYPMALKGEAGRAIGIATTQSVVGGLIGVVVLACFTPIISDLSIHFGPLDYVILGFMGLLMVGSLGGASLTRSIISAALGLLISLVGQDIISGRGRFTFGNTYLLAGVSTVVAMIGLYGMTEGIAQVHSRQAEVVKQKVDRIVPEFKVVKKHMGLTLRSSIIGSIVGALPGAGASIAALLAYDTARRTVKDPEVPFGEGAIEGVVAPETANNAVTATAFIPMLTLGVPGDAVTAVMMGALTVHGLRMGPTLMIEQPDLFYVIVMLLVVANICLLVCGLTGIRVFAKFVEIPRGRLIPLIVILCVTGSFAINNSMTDVLWTIGFGIVGYLLKKCGYPISPMVLGIILGRLIESNLRRAFITFRGIGGTLMSIVNRPITLVLFLMLAVSVLVQTEWWKKRKKRRANYQEKKTF